MRSENDALFARYCIRAEPVTVSIKDRRRPRLLRKRSEPHRRMTQSEELPEIKTTGHLTRNQKLIRGIRSSIVVRVNFASREGNPDRGS